MVHIVIWCMVSQEETYITSLLCLVIIQLSQA